MRRDRPGRAAASNGHAHRDHGPDPKTTAVPGSFGRAWTAFGRRVPRLRNDLQCYANVQLDRARMVVEHTLSRVVVVAIVVLSLSMFSALAAGMALFGIAGGVATLLGGRLWLAGLLTGCGTLFVVVLAVQFARSARQRRRLAQLRHRYRREPPDDDVQPAPTGAAGARDAQ